MRLDVLAPQMRDSPHGGVLINGLTADSRAVQQGYLFAALHGEKLDGTQFVTDAVARGAAAVLAVENISGAQVPIVTAENPRLALAQMAGRFFEYQPDRVACVTGTNGKSSVAAYVRQLWQALGFKAACIGTLGVEGDGINWSLAHTTPEPIELHGILRDLAAHHISHLVVEASSHGLAQYRLDGVRVAVAGFTNLTRDHLDYHADEAAYLAAKQRLFTEVLAADGTAVVSVADKAGKAIAKAAGAAGRQVLTTGTEKTDLHIAVKEAHPQGQKLAVTYQSDRAEFDVSLIGAFQAQNLEIAFGIALAMGAEISALCAAAKELHGARGRMQYIGQTKTGAAVYVDYAHTPDALRHALTALREHGAGGETHVVFGCGGERDVGKRAQMGGIAAIHADNIYVTDDNPRGEDAAAIRETIIAAVPSAYNIEGRAEAIAAAITAAEKSDSVLIAGKGHEQGQIIGNEIVPFDDAEIARGLLATGRGV